LPPQVTKRPPTARLATLPKFFFVGHLLLNGDSYNSDVPQRAGSSSHDHGSGAGRHSYNGSGCGWLVERVAAVLRVDLMNA
jgi:hypothetical protein